MNRLSPISRSAARRQADNTQLLRGKPSALVGCPSCHREGAFSLVELLAVLAITTVLMVVSGPSLSALNQAGSTNKISADLSGLLELSRSHAMSRQTYVRLAIANVSPGTAKMPEGGLVILPLSSAEGTLTAGSPADMTDAAKWIALGRPLLLENFDMVDTLDATSPDTSGDMLPSSSDIGQGTGVCRQVPGFGDLTFEAFIQFEPDGRAGVDRGTPARQIKIALDKRGGQAARNPVIIRLSGNNGAVAVLRGENGVK